MALSICTLFILLSGLIDSIRKRFGRCPKKRRAVRFAFTSVKIMSKPRKTKPMNVQLRTTQYVDIGVSPVGPDGEIEPIDGKPVVEVISGDAKASIVEQDGGSVVRIVPSDTPGKSRVRVTGDADLSEGAKPIEGIVDLDAIAPEAVTFNFGEPVFGNKKDLPA